MQVHRHGERTAIYDIPTAGQKPQTIRDGFPKEAILTTRGISDMYGKVWKVEWQTSALNNNYPFVRDD